MPAFDLAIVGAGIMGLAHALAAVRRGLRVVVIERDARANGASVRNFGFVTITGQEAGDTRRRALRSREIWEAVAREAAVDILQRGTLFVARRPEALAVLEEFAAGEMGDGCELLSARDARGRLPQLRAGIAGALASPHELRIEARDAIAAIAAWLEDRHGVVFSWSNPLLSIEGTTVRHAHGTLEAEAVVLAPGTAVGDFAPQYARRVELAQCTLQMMRIAAPGARLPAVVMSDLSLLRYGGLASLGSAAALRERVERECPRAIAEGIHLIVAQSSDGSLVIGDSHRHAALAGPFASAATDELILDELRALLDLQRVEVTERWLGHYAVATVKPLLRETLAPRVELVSVTNGLGMSTAFAIGEETIAGLFA
ncbi:MAG: TIGR03364 family FAD-dependent oxidoreductase [Usitatibacter sp.]